MRICFTVERLSPTGGREVSSLQLSRELARLGHDIDLLYSFGGELEAEYRVFCRSITQAHLVVRRPRLVRNIARAVPALWGVMRKRPDVVYVQSFADIPFGVLASRLTRTRLVCHLRGYAYYRKAELLGRQVSRFIAVSEDTRSRWGRVGVDMARIDVVHNGVELGEYPFGGEPERDSARRRLGIPPAQFVVLYYGRLDAEKGVEVLLEAWRKLDMPETEGRLVIMGGVVIDSDPEASAQRLRELAPAGCQWLPFQRDVVTLLHAADVVVLPSFAEGFGRTIIEAMASGRPAVGSRVGGTPEALTPPFDRYLFEPGDAGGLARVLAGLTDWRRTDPGLGERCRSHVVDRFTIQRTAAGVEKVLMSVVKGRAGREEPRQVSVG